jgi:uncharacterized caspase-like protein
MKTLRWSFCILVLLMGNMVFTPVYAMGGNSSPPIPAGGTNNPQRHALIIGNSSYTSTAPLENPAKDARLIAAALTNANFNVRLHIDLTQKQMKRVLRDFSRDLRSIGPDAISLVYFAGHGTQVAGRNYLVPVDADIEVEADVSIETLAVDEILGQLENNTGALSIIILDACRNNPYKRGRRASVRGLAPVKASKGSIIAYSTAPGTVALDGTGDNSPYATALNKYLRVGGLSIEKMFKNVRVEVDKMTRGSQTPWEESSLFGDFVFLPALARPARPRLQTATSGGRKNSSDTRLAAETAFWNTIKDSNNSSGIESYLRTFPRGLFAPLAKMKLAEQKARHKKSLELIKQQRVSSLVREQEKKSRSHMPSPRTKAKECIEYFRKDGTDTYCVSSRLKSQQKNSYGVASLLDNSNYTAWFEGKSNDGIGEWVLVDFGELRKVDRLILKNGYNKNKEIYYKNSRIRSMRLTFSNGRKHVIALTDDPGEQVFKIARNVTARWVKMTILSVKRGNKYKDTGLNELRVVSSAISK